MFGKNVGKYQDILGRMDALCEEARELVEDVKSERGNDVRASSGQPRTARSGGTTAEDIRRYVLDNYITPARARGEKTVTIRSGDVHDKLGLDRRLPQVCQVLRNRLLCRAAGVRLVEGNSKRPGAYVKFKYEL